MKNIEEKIIAIDTIIPELKKNIDTLFKKTENIEKEIDEINSNITEIKTILKNQFNWIDKWKLITSAIIVAGGFVSIIISIIYFYKGK